MKLLQGVINTPNLNSYFVSDLLGTNLYRLLPVVIPGQPGEAVYFEDVSRRLAWIIKSRPLFSTSTVVVRTITKVSLVGLCIVLDFGNEHWTTIRIKNDQGYYEVDCVTQAEIIWEVLDFSA